MLHGGTTTLVPRYICSIYRLMTRCFVPRVRLMARMENQIKWRCPHMFLVVSSRCVQQGRVCRITDTVPVQMQIAVLAPVCKLQYACNELLHNNSMAPYTTGFSDQCWCISSTWYLDKWFTSHCCGSHGRGEGQPSTKSRENMRKWNENLNH